MLRIRSRGRRSCPLRRSRVAPVAECLPFKFDANICRALPVSYLSSAYFGKRYARVRPVEEFEGKTSGRKTTIFLVFPASWRMNNSTEAVTRNSPPPPPFPGKCHTPSHARHAFNPANISGRWLHQCVGDRTRSDGRRRLPSVLLYRVHLIYEIFQQSRLLFCRIWRNFEMSKMKWFCQSSSMRWHFQRIANAPPSINRDSVILEPHFNWTYSLVERFIWFPLLHNKNFKIWSIEEPFGWISWPYRWLTLWKRDRL